MAICWPGRSAQLFVEALCMHDGGSQEEELFGVTQHIYSHMSRRPRLHVQEEEASEDPVQAAIAAKKAKQGGQHMCCSSPMLLCSANNQHDPLCCTAEERLRSAAREAARAFAGGAATVFFDEGISAAEKRSAGVADYHTLTRCCRGGQHATYPCFPGAGQSSEPANGLAALMNYG